MSKTKFAAAKELIAEKKYHEARSILKTIDHPTAREWESKLDRISPVHGIRALINYPSKPVGSQELYAGKSSRPNNDIDEDILLEVKTASTQSATESIDLEYELSKLEQKSVHTESARQSKTSAMYLTSFCITTLLGTFMFGSSVQTNGAICFGIGIPLSLLFGWLAVRAWSDSAYQPS